MLAPTKTLEELEDDVSTVVAALSCLPVWCLRGTSRAISENTSSTRNPPRWPPRPDATSMELLDAFASICVRQASDAFAVTYEVKNSRVRLYVATSSKDGVSSDVRAHLELVWNTMKTMATHANESRERELCHTDQGPKTLFADFVPLLYRFSWPALAQRFSATAEEVTQRLDEVLHRSPKSHENALLHRCSPDLTDDERTFSLKLRFALLRARRAILENSSEGQHCYSDIHTVLGDLSRELEGADAALALRHLDALTGATLTSDIRSLLWLVKPVDALRTFVHSVHFTELLELAFEVVSIPSVTVTRRLNFNSHPVGETDSYYRDSNDPFFLAFMAERAYRDGKMKTEEPNFESDFAEHVLHPVRRCCSQTEPGIISREITAHAEPVLLAHFIKKSTFPYYPPYIRYIGTSEPTCLPCYRYINEINWNPSERINAMYVRGTDGRIPLYWTPCEKFYSQDMLYAISKDFCAALSILREHLTQSRKAARQARGEDPVTLAEQQYCDAAAESTKPPYFMQYLIDPSG
ncbi:hypothetical protein AURDEDRAFT_174986 [Auricularia subglabra TFB-10046 SS5]|nr:hypothetical protein AURDEDRAFT_174986 [Auricularia subglabra TFB-10046 SS5]